MSVRILFLTKERKFFNAKFFLKKRNIFAFMRNWCEIRHYVKIYTLLVGTLHLACEKISHIAKFDAKFIVM